MGLRLLKSENIANSNLMLTLPKGKYRRLAFHVFGTNAGGQSFSASDIDFTLERGENKVSLNLLDMQNNNNYDGGFPTATSTAGGTLNLFACHDFFLPGDRNNIFLAGTDDTRLQLVWGNKDKVSTGSIAVYAEYGEGTENYITKWKNINFSLPGSANAQVTQNITDKNIVRFYIRTASDISSLSLKKDSKEVVFATGSALSALSSYEGKAEAAVSFIVADLSGSRTPSDLISSDVSFTVQQSGSATQCYAWIQTLEINAQKLQESATSLQVSNNIAAQTYPPVRQAANIQQMINIAE